MLERDVHRAVFLNKAGDADGATLTYLGESSVVVAQGEKLLEVAGLSTDIYQFIVGVVAV